MKSVRLGDALEKRLARAAEHSGKSESEIIREGVERRCDELLSESLADRVSDLVGSVQGDGSGWTRDVSSAYARSLVKSRRKRDARAPR